MAELGRGVLQAIGLVAINKVLGHLLAPGSTTERLTHALPALTAVAVTAVLSSALASRSTRATGTLEPKVQRVATERYLGLVARVELSAIEDDEFHKLLDSASWGADSARRMIKYCTAVANAAISLTAAAGVLTVLHPALLPLLVAMTVPRAWNSMAKARRRYISFHRFVQHARAGMLLGRLLIDPQAAPEVRVHDVGPFLLDNYRAMAETSEHEQTRLARLDARSDLLADAATGVATALTYGVLGLLLWSGAMALSVAGTAVLAIRTGSSSLDRLVLQTSDLHQEALFVGDYERLCQEAAERAIPATGESLPPRVERIRFEHVTFTYPGEDNTPSLKGVDLTIPTGKIVALVGSNGSGKSTLVKLLCGLYTPDAGRILWNGTDAAAADRAEIFRRVAIVAQDFYRWPFTARVNVGIGQPSSPLRRRGRHHRGPPGRSRQGHRRSAPRPEHPPRARLQGRPPDLRRPVAAHRYRPGPLPGRRHPHRRRTDQRTRRPGREGSLRPDPRPRRKRPDHHPDHPPPPQRPARRRDLRPRQG